MKLAIIPLLVLAPAVLAAPIPVEVMARDAAPGYASYGSYTPPKGGYGKYNSYGKYGSYGKYPREAEAAEVEKRATTYSNCESKQD